MVGRRDVGHPSMPGVFGQLPRVGARSVTTQLPLRVLRRINSRIVRETLRNLGCDVMDPVDEAGTMTEARHKNGRESPQPSRTQRSLVRTPKRNER